MVALPQEPFGFFKVIGLGSRVWVQSFKRIFLLSVLCAIITVVPSHVATVFQPGLDVAMRFVVAGILILLAIFGLGFEAAIYLQLNATGLQDKPLTFLNALGAGLRNLWRIFLATLLLILLFLLAIAVVIAPFMLARVYWPQYANYLDTAAIVFTGFICFYVLINFVIYLPLIVVGQLGPIAALKRSFHLVKHGWWQTTCLMVFLLVIMLLLQRISMFITAAPIAATIIALIIAIFYFPFYASVFLVQMHQLGLRDKHFKK